MPDTKAAMYRSSSFAAGFAVDRWKAMTVRKRKRKQGEPRPPLSIAEITANGKWWIFDADHTPVREVTCEEVKAILKGTVNNAS